MYKKIKFSNQLLDSASTWATIIHHTFSFCFLSVSTGNGKTEAFKN
jgi:hypothetical protein